MHEETRQVLKWDWWDIQRNLMKIKNAKSVKSNPQHLEVIEEIILEHKKRYNEWNT